MITAIKNLSDDEKTILAEAWKQHRALQLRATKTENLVKNNEANGVIDEALNAKFLKHTDTLTKNIAEFRQSQPKQIGDALDFLIKQNPAPGQALTDEQKRDAQQIKEALRTNTKKIAPELINTISAVGAAALQTPVSDLPVLGNTKPDTENMFRDGKRILEFKDGKQVLVQKFDSEKEAEIEARKRGIAPTLQEQKEKIAKNKDDVLIHNQEYQKFPTNINQQFLLIGNRVVYKDDPKKILFVDKGDKLTTPRDVNALKINTMLDVAEARGWNEIKLTGTKEFRQQAYMEATARGLAVSGYTPSKEERATAERMAEQRGKLNGIQDHPAATRYLDARSQETRKEAMKAFPELKAAFSYEYAMHTFAKDRIPLAQREAFMSQTRQNIAASIRNGDPLPEVKMRTASQERPKQDLERD
jgi:Large polyvalent protein-associated domain 7